MSNLVPVLSSVFQCSVLGSQLFINFLNDFPSNLLDAVPRLFADDLKFLFNCLNSEADLVHLHSRNRANRMLAKLFRIKCVVWRGYVSVYLSNELIEKIKLRKDLGIIIRQNLKWTNHLSTKLSKAQRLYFLLRNSVQWSTPFSVNFNICSSTVLSVTMYASRVWMANFCSLTKIETFQKQCFKWIFPSKLA